jgi:hypothetical protein
MHVTRFQLQKARVAVVAARACHVMYDNIAPERVSRRPTQLGLVTLPYTPPHVGHSWKNTTICATYSRQDR